MTPTPHLAPKQSSISSAGTTDVPSRSFLEKLPKCELHVHLEGTLEADLLFQLAQRNAVPLNYASIEELKQAYKFKNLQEFLDLYYRGAAVLQKQQDFDDLTWVYLLKCQQEAVGHVEVFFDPQTHTDRGIDIDVVVSGIHGALERGKHELGISYKLIPCFLRHLTEAAAFETLDQLQPYYSIITAFGLDSSEVGHPPAKFERVFGKVREFGFQVVAHAGEEGPPDPYLWDAIQKLQVNRIDHGIQSLEDESLCKHLAESQMALTLCPLSNLELQVVKDLQDYPLRQLLKHNLLVTINSDDPAYFGGYVTENYWRLVEALGLTVEECVLLAKNSFRGSFLSNDEKNKWIAQINKYCDDAQLTTISESAVIVPNVM